MNLEGRKIRMKLSRQCGTYLFENGLIDLNALEETNRVLADGYGENNPEEFLSILFKKTKKLEEEKYLEHIHENMGVSFIKPKRIENEDVKKKVDIEFCKATLTVPFDEDEDSIYVATPYAICELIEELWKEKTKKEIIIFGCTIEDVDEIIEEMEKGIKK